MADEITIPILPCRAINETLEFYVAMGFEITFQQAKPNTYGCVKRDGINLHFFTLRDYEPANSYSTCFVLVPDVDALYKAFADGLRAHYGRLPVAGIPRIGKPSNKYASGERRFNVVDPGGNWIRIGQRTETPEPVEKPEKGKSTKLSRAFAAADFLASKKADFAAAANMLDGALGGDEPAIERLPALVLRAELAISLGDMPLAEQLLTEVRQISLTEDEKAAFSEELEQASDLEQMLPKASIYPPTPKDGN